MGEADMDLDAEARALAKQRGADQPAAPRTMEIECRKCRRKTTHELITAEEGVAVAHCVRCRDIDAEAAKLVDERDRQQEIAYRANAMRDGTPKVQLWQVLLILFVGIPCVLVFVGEDLMKLLKVMLG